MRPQLNVSQSSIRSEDTSPFTAAVDRCEELARLRARSQKRKSMLVFGPEGVGKTKLLQQFVKTEPLALYVSQTGSPRELMLSIIQSLRAAGQRGLRFRPDLMSCSTNSLRACVDAALDQIPFLLVLDQVSGPSRVVTGIIKDLNYFDRTPILFASRTYHMEDVGTLQSICSDRSERTEVKNFVPEIALQFARKQAEQAGLYASNLNVALASMVEWSQGNPGSLIQMVAMAMLPKYRIEDQIKVHVLYLDHLMGRHQVLPRTHAPIK
ncbi:MAG: NB-ARC domain-containing protein [Acidobacteriaceae bacterium]